MKPWKEWFNPKWVFHYVFNEFSESKLNELFSFKESEKRSKSKLPPFLQDNLPIPIKVKRHSDKHTFESERRFSKFNKNEGDNITHIVPLIYEYGTANSKLNATSLDF